jgi:5-methylcytosine-specific restriction endonuclease McrA
MRNLKQLMVEYKGGCCQKCGYNKYKGALEFHHTDPSQKDFTPSRLKRYKFNDLVKKELDKCMLLCSNCHKEIHYEILQEKNLSS